MALLTSGAPSMGILLSFPQPCSETELRRSVALGANRKSLSGKGVVGFLGAGNYAGRTLIPAFKAAGAHLHTVVSSGGVSAVHFGRKFGFADAATDTALVLENSEIDTVAIATRHNVHGSQVLAALRAGKHVFCEKPLCLTLDELAAIESEAQARPSQQLMVGFNRRFAPQVLKMKALLVSIDEPKSVIITVNAGEISPDHWTQDLAVGGGRIIGEACHFVDLARHLVGAPIIAHRAVALGRHAAMPVRGDKVTLMLEFADGSVASIHYLANGNKGYPKERVEVFAGGRILQLENFLRLRGWGWPGFSKMNLWRQDKGAHKSVSLFLNAIREGRAALIPLDEVVEVSGVSIKLAQELL